MIKSSKHISTFSKGVDQDTSVNKLSNDVYFDAENFRIISNESSSSGAISTVKGNTLRLSFPVGDVVLGFCKIRSNIDTDKDAIVFFNYNGEGGTTSKIYLFDGDPFRVGENVDMSGLLASHTYNGTYTYESGLIYANSGLAFDPSHPIKAEGRYESEEIRKVYWVDGLNNIRYMILDRVSTGDSVTIFDVNPTATLSEPIATVISGGSYTAGTVQYAYQLYIKNGAVSTYSPLSPLLFLTSNDGGVDSKTFTGSSLGDNTGKAVQLVISNLDQNYNRIRIVAIHYTELLVNPTINIVGELGYTGTSLTFVDNGYTVYGTVPLEEFRIFGQVNYIANSLASEYNYLFFADITEDKWNPDWLDPTDVGFWDARAVRFIQGAALSDSTTTDAISSSHGGPDFIMELSNVNKDVLTVTINNFTSYASIPESHTITSIDSITSTQGAGAILGNMWAEVDDTLHSFSATLAESIFAVISYTGDVLIYTITTSGTDFVGAETYDHIENGGIASITFTYSYDYPDPADVEAVVYDGIDSLTIDSGLTNWGDYVFDHDGVNKYNNIIYDGNTVYEYKYQSDGGTFGAEGLNVLVEFETEDLQIDSTSSLGYASILYPYTDSAATTSHRESQRTEVYRTYLVFFNTKMQYSNPQWICDLRIPSNNDLGFQTIITNGVTGTREGRYIYPKVTLKNIPVDANLYGWQVFRCERGSSDRSVMASGVLSTCVKETFSTFTDLVRPYSIGSAAPYSFIRAEDGAVPSADRIIEIVSPEILFNKNLYYTSGDKLRVDGRYTTVDSDSVVVDTTNWHVTLSLGVTTNRDAGDTILYTVNEGHLQSPGIITSGPTLPPFQSIGNELYKHTLAYANGADVYYGNRGSSFIAAISTDLVTDPTTTGYIYGAYLRNVFSTQYGGNTYEARSYNSVIPYSTFVLKDAVPNSVTCYNGDTFISVFAYLRTGWPNIDVSGTDHAMQEMIYIPAESSINSFYRLDPIQKYYSPTASTYKLQETVEQGLQLQPNDYPLELGDLYRYNSVYSKSGNARLIQNVVFDSNNIEHSDVKVIATGKKINNEYSDSWTNLYTNNYIELDPKYGPINNIFSFNNKLFTGQNKAIAVLAVNDRSTIQDNNKIQLTLGTGGVLERYDYLTTSSGFQNYYDMSVSDKSFYYLDRRNKIIYTLTQNGDTPISEINGYRSFLKTYNNISTVRVAYDPIYKEVFFYISDGTILKNSLFNEYTNSFNGKHTFSPSLMFNLNDQFYSVLDNTIYLHNYGNYGDFYNTVNDSFITIIINPNGNIVNKFDVLELRVDVDDNGTLQEDEQFTSIVMSNNYQGPDTKTIAFSGDDSVEDTSKSLIRKWRTILLPDDMSNDFYRMTDTYIKLKLIRDNTGNKKLTCHDLITYFRPVKN
jgi:hypothetical protein